MPLAELKEQMEAGVVFWGMEQGGQLAGVMGTQPVQDVILIRHAYVRTVFRNRGIGGQMLKHLHALAPGPVLIGAWAAATWAIAFYEKHGFRKVIPTEKDRLLKMYWAVPARQIETSVVLADNKWFQNCPAGTVSLNQPASTTEAVNISLAMTPSDTLVTEPVISIA